ncbi:MAG: DUF2059 domain-containing protein [Candidatus Ratteibacteria bacterium]|jgi:hypothetical protein
MKKRIGVSMLIAGIMLFSLSQNAKGEDRRALAEELLNVKQMQKTIEGNLAAMKRRMTSQLNNNTKIMGQDVPASAIAMQKKRFDLIAEEMSWDKVKDDYISVYAATYTEEELKAQIDFYRSTAGRAVAGKESELSEKVAELNQKRMIQIMPKIQAIMKDSVVQEVYPEAETKCLTNLKMIGLALQMYAQDHKNKFPDDLKEIYQKYSYVKDPSVFWCPADTNPKPTDITNSVPNQPNSCQISYTYYPGHSANERSVADVIIMEDNNPEHHNGRRNCLFADGHVELR